MEHLVRPTSAASQPYETVAYISNKYDGGDFLTYPDSGRQVAYASFST